LGGVKAIHLPYQFVSFSDDGKFVSGQKEGVYLWSSAPKTAAALNVPLASIVCSQMVTHIARLPSSERFLIATADETLHLWDPNSPSEITRLYAHGIQVQTTAFSPDERTLAIGALNGQIQLRDLQSGQLLLTLHGGAGRVLQLRFDEDGTRLYALCETEQGSGELLMWGRVHGVGNDRD
jgi:WD40 repeat protein